MIEIYNTEQQKMLATLNGHTADVLMLAEMSKILRLDKTEITLWCELCNIEITAAENGECVSKDAVAKKVVEPTIPTRPQPFWQNARHRAMLGLTDEKRPEPTASVMPDLSGFVYLFKCEHLYKIGKSKNPQKRLKTLQDTIGAFPIELIHTIVCAEMQVQESTFHKQFADKRVRGEWFELDEKDVEYILGIDVL